MAVFTKVFDFAEQIGRGVHQLHTHNLNMFLTSDTPSSSLDSVKADVTEVTGGANGYTAGGILLTGVTWVETAGTATLDCTNNPSWTATGAGIANIRAAVLMNDSVAAPLVKPLIGSWDYGSTIALLASGESFTVTVTTNILTLA